MSLFFFFLVDVPITWIDESGWINGWTSHKMNAWNNKIATGSWVGG